MTTLQDFNNEMLEIQYLPSSDLERLETLKVIRTKAVHAFYKKFYIQETSRDAKKASKEMVKWLDERDVQIIKVPKEDSFIVCSKVVSKALFARVLWQDNIAQYMFTFVFEPFDLQKYLDSKDTQMTGETSHLNGK